MKVAEGIYAKRTYSHSAGHAVVAVNYGNSL